MQISYLTVDIEDAGMKPLSPPVYNVLQNSSDSHFCFWFRQYQLKLEYFLITPKNIEVVLETIYQTWINNVVM